MLPQMERHRHRKRDERLQAIKEEQRDEEFETLRASHSKLVLAQCIMDGTGPTDVLKSQYGHCRNQMNIHRNNLAVRNAAITALETAASSQRNRKMLKHTLSDLKKYSCKPKKEEELLKNIFRVSQRHQCDVLGQARESLEGIAPRDDFEDEAFDDELRADMDKVAEKMLRSAPNLDSMTHSPNRSSCSMEDNSHMTDKTKK